MPETLTTAPATPAPASVPAPAAPSQPAPTPAKVEATPAGEDSGAELESAFDKLESRFGTKATPKENPDKSKAKDEKPVVTGADKKPIAAAPAKEVSKEDRQFQEGPKVLRERLEKTSKERDDLSKSISELKTKITEYEARGKDTSALTDQLAAERKEKEQLQAEMRALKQEASPEFKKQWDLPFERMVGHAMNDLKNMAVLGEKDPDTGEPRSADRPAVWSDFQQLYTMPLNKAIAASRKMFSPEDSSIVEDHLKTLKRFDLQRGEALEEEKAKWKENTTREIAEQAAQKENFQKASAKTREALLAEHPDWYADDPADPEGNELLKTGRDYLNHVPRTMDEAVRNYERNKLNAEAFPRMADRLEKAKARIAELEAQLEENKNSSPGTTRRTTSGAPAKEALSFEEDVRKNFSAAS